MVDPDPRKFSEGVKLFQHTLLRIVLQHLGKRKAKQQSSIPGVVHYGGYQCAVP